MKKIAAVFLFTLLVTNVFAQTPSISQIRAKWNQLKPKAGVKMYEKEPSATQPYRAGSLTRDFLTNGENVLNFARYLAGLPAVKLQSTYNSECQSGALVIAAIGTLTHHPSQPRGMSAQMYKTGSDACAHSNLFQGHSSATLEDAVRGFLNDSDSNNIDSVGHRRWALNPGMGKTGFGCVTSPQKGNYISMYAFDRSGTGNKDRVLWPNEGYFPTDFFTPGQAWSISLDSSVYSNTAAGITDISVKLTCLNNNKVWNFSKANTNKSENYFNVDTGGYGMGLCIIFRPGDHTYYGDNNNKYRVEVTGLKKAVPKNATKKLVKKGGGVVEVVELDVDYEALPKMQYDVEFFSL